MLFSKVDVLLGDLNKSVSFSESDVRASQIGNARSKINKRGESLRWGVDRIRTFNSSDPIIKVDRKKSWIHNSFRKQYQCQNPRLIVLERFIDRFSLNGKIWHHVWKHSLLHSCIAKNRFETLQRNFLIEINLYRKVHGSEPLKLDPYLSRKALDAATRSAALGKWIYSEIIDVGINFETINVGLSPILINKWYKEYKGYNYKTFDWMTNSVHFTNLIWKHTTAVGIGIAQKRSDLYICLQFFPEGNQKNKFRDNVGRARYHLVNYRSLIKA
uniref:SCP domain-containing protein n=1 Tax=Strongyloides papillosus TaxID=174720 RepID=A0A0N5B293_STREA